MSNLVAVGQTVYNFARLAVTFDLKNSPETHKFILALDAIDTCITAGRVWKEFASNKSQRYYALVCMAGSASLAFWLTKFSQIDLHKIVKQTPTPNLTLAGKRPLVVTLACGLLAARIALNCGLLILQPKFDLPVYVQSTFQAITFLQTMRPKWTEVTRTYPNPFSTMKCSITEGGTPESFQATAQKIQATFYLRRTNSDIPTFQSAIESVVTYSANMFENSSWSRFWERVEGIRTIRENYNDRLSMENFDKSLTLWGPLRKIQKTLRLTSACDVVYNATLSPDSSKPPAIFSMATEIFHEDLAVVRPPVAVLLWFGDGCPARMYSMWTRINFLKR